MRTGGILHGFRCFCSPTTRLFLASITIVVAHALTISLETFEIAVRERGWTADAIEDWWSTSLGEAILAER